MDGPGRPAPKQPELGLGESSTGKDAAETAGAKAIRAGMADTEMGGARTGRCWEGLAGMAMEEDGHRVGVEPRIFQF